MKFFSLSRAFALLVLLVSHVGVQAAWTDNGDGTVTDTATGLVWDQCALGLSGSSCGSGTVTALEFKQALAAAVSQNGGAGYKGYTDWRVPNKNELESLVSRTDLTTVDPVAFPASPGRGFWTSLAHSTDITQAWQVDFADGAVSVVPQGSLNAVRLVRGGNQSSDFDAFRYTLLPVSQSVSGVVGVPLAATPAPTAHGFSGTLSYASSPALPTGLSLDAATGVITGTPTATQSATDYTITATDTSNNSASNTVSLTITPGAGLTPRFALPVPTADGFTVSILNYDNNYAWAGTATAGTVTISANGLVTVSGLGFATASTATVTTTRTGYSAGSDTLTGTSRNAPALTPASLTLSGRAGRLITPTTAPVPSDFEGSLSYAVTGTALPTGLTLDADTGIISGTPTAAQSASSYTITATGSVGGSASFSVSISVDPAPAVTLSSASLSGTVNSFLTGPTPTPAHFSAAVTYSISPSLPAGVSLDSSTGVISGTPVKAQPARDYSLTASDGSGESASATVSLSISPTLSPNAQVMTSGVRYASISPSQTLVPTGFSGQVSYSVSPALPNGLQISSRSGVISGTPRELHSSSIFTITGTDGSNSATTAVMLAVTAGSGPSLSPTTQTIKGPIGQAITPTQAYTGAGFEAGVVYGQVSLFAGVAGTSNTAGAVNGYRLGAASFSTPQGVTMDAQGALYVTDAVNHAIRKIDSAGEVTTLASGGDIDSPSGITRDSSGNLYVTSTHRVLKITPAGAVSVLAGDASSAGFTNATGAAARFSSPKGIAISADDSTLYVADSGNRRIREITISSGAVTTFAGTGTQGSTDGSATSAQFDTPVGVAVTAAGIVYVSDSGNHLIRKITPNLILPDEVSTLAGNGAASSIDGLGEVAGFNQPKGLALDGAGNLYVAEAGGNLIRKITPAGRVTTLAGSGSAGVADGVGSAARFAAPTALYFDPTGSLFVVDATYNTLRQITMTGFAVSPALPAGLSLASDTGVVNGAPSESAPAGGALATHYSNNFEATSLAGASDTGNAGRDRECLHYSWGLFSGTYCDTYTDYYMRLTDDATNKSGTFTVPASNVNAQAYRVNFHLIVGNPNGADGVSYSFTDNPGTTSWDGEVGTGNRLTVGFDLYGGNKGIRVMYGAGRVNDPPNLPGNDAVLAYSSSMAWAAWENGDGRPVIIDIDKEGRLTLTVNGTVIFDQLQLPEDYRLANRASWQHVFKGRTGGTKSLQAIDAVTIKQSDAGAATYAVSGYNYQGSDSASLSVLLGDLPEAPTSLVATPASGSASIAFTPPVPSTGLSYQYKVEGGAWTSAAVSSNTLTVPGLTNGTSYAIAIRAVNSIGAGPAAETSVIPRGAPDAPTPLTATPGNGKVEISFTAGSDNGSPITNYQYSINNGSSWTSAAVFSSPLTVSGLTNGTAYTIKVRAVNAIGAGTDVATVLATPVASVPDAPSSVTTSVAVNNVTVNWSAPVDTGGASLSGYRVEMTTNPTNETSYVAPAGCTATTTSTARTCTATGLATGTYFFRVSALNSVGSSDYAYGASGANIPNLIPDAPSIVEAKPGNKQAIISFTAGADNGLAIQNYEYSLNNGSTWISAEVDASPITITGLTNGTAYSTIKIRAVNAAGAGTASVTVPSVTPATLPAAPTSLVATAGDQQASVAFTAGANGGAAISNYQYSTDDGATWTAFNPADTVSPVTISNLTNGTVYNLQLRAVNAVGVGPAGVTSAIPRGVPAAPTAVSGQGDNGKVIVSWSAPSNDGGSEITEYAVTSSPGAKTCSASGVSTSCVVTGLTNGTAYTFTATATNVVGTSSASSPSAAVTPATLPGAPTGLNATAGDAEVTLSWTAPTNNGGAAITRYTVTAESDSSKACEATAGTSCSVTGLTNGTSYTFRVTATNGGGTGPESIASSAVTPRTVPSAPIDPVAVAGDGAATVSWTAPDSDGGSAITGYSVTGTPSGSCTSAGATRCSVTGLTNDTAYTFTIKASNVAGTGTDSAASESVTPKAPAITPSIQSISAKVNSTISPSASMVANSSFTGAVTYSISPALPGGLLLDTTTGVVSGTPSTESASTVYTLTATGATSGSATSTLTINVDKRSQATVVLEAQPAQIFVNQTSTLKTSGGSGSGAVTFTRTTGTDAVCTYDGTTGVVTATGVGTCEFRATQAADTVYVAETSGLVTVTMQLGTQETLTAYANPITITASESSASPSSGGTSALTVVGGSGSGAVTYAVAETSCAIVNGTLTSTAAGSCTLTATKAADSAYSAVSSGSITVTVVKAEQATLVASSTQNVLAVGDTTTLSTSGGSGNGLVSYAVADTSICEVLPNSSTLKANARGICSVTATQAGTATVYEPATSSPIYLTVNLRPQPSLTVIPAASSLSVYGSTTLSYSGGDGSGAVTYAVAPGAPCTLSNGLLVATGAGNCAVTASKAGDATFAEATSGVATVSVSLGAQQPLLLSASPEAIKVNETATLSVTGGSGTGAVSYNLVSGPCSLSGNTLSTLGGAGDCRVNATKAADDGYASVTASEIVVSVSLNTQSALMASASKTILDLNDTSTLSSTGGSGNGAISYEVVSGQAQCDIPTGSTIVTGISAGSCSVRARKAATSEYAEAVSTPVTIIVGLTQQARLSVVANPSTLEVNRFTQLSATGGSGDGEVTFQKVSGPCDVSDTTVSGTGAGSCVVTARKAASGVYASTQSDPLTIVVGLSPQSVLTLLASPSSVNAGGTVTLDTTGGSGTGAVSYSVQSGDCSVTNTTLTASTAGQCVVLASKAEDSAFAAAESRPVTLTVGLSPQASLTAAVSPTTINVNATASLTVTGGSGNGGVAYRLLDGPCTVNGSTVTGNSAGSCTLEAVKAADSSFAELTSAPVTLTVGLAPQSPLTLSANPSTINVEDRAFLSTQGGSSTGETVYTLDSGPCSIDDNRITGKGKGSCVITAVRAADSAYARVSSTPLTLTIGLAPQSALSAVVSPSTVSVSGTASLSSTGGSGTGAVSYSLLSGPCSITGSSLTGTEKGSCTLTATKAEDTRYAAETSPAFTVTVDLAPQSALSVLSDQTALTVNSTSQLSSSGGSGTGGVSYTLVSGPCLLDGSLLKGLQAGSCTVTATKAADANFSVITSESLTLPVGLIPQDPLDLSTVQSTVSAQNKPSTFSAMFSIFSAPAPVTLNVNATVPLTTTGGSGTGSVTYTLEDGPCSLSGNVLKGLDVGTCKVRATKAADAMYAETRSEILLITVGLTPQSDWEVSADNTTIQTSGISTLSTTAGSNDGNGAETYELVSGPCSITGNILTGIQRGSCSVTATKAASGGYAAKTSAPISILVGLSPQPTLSVTSTPASINVGGTSTLNIAGGAGTGLEVVSLLSGPCTLSGTTLTGTSAGTCSIGASKAANNVYSAATASPITVSVNLNAQQALSVSAEATSIYVGDSTTVSATGGSGQGDISYSASGTGCAITGNVLKADAAGVCTVTATRNGDVSYDSISSQAISVQVIKRPQSQLWLIADNTVLNINGTSTLSTTGGSASGTVTYAVAANDPCSVSGDTLTANGLGNCTVTATMAGDDTYTPVTSDSISIDVVRYEQAALSASASATEIYVNGTATLSATGGSGTGVLSYAVEPGHPCSISGNLLTATGTGFCTITASRAGDSDYAVGYAQPLTINVVLSPQAQLVASPGLSQLKVNETTILSTAGGSGTGLVIYSVGPNDPCTISADVLTAIGEGLCTITATKAADSEYDVATAAPITVSVGRHQQAQLVASASSLQLNVNGTTTLSTTGGSGTGLVSYAVAQNDPCSISADVLTATGAGQCTITATKAGDIEFHSASALPITVSVALNAQNPLVASASLLQLNVNGTTSLSTTGGSGTGLVSYAVAQNDPCSISGNLLTATGAGQCTITASKAADSVYDLASAMPITVSVALNAQNPLVASAILLQLNVNGTTTLSTTGGSGTGLVSYSVAPSNVCSISGNQLTATGAGQCTITASKAADSVYDVASATPITVSVALNAQNPLVASASLLQLNVNGTTTLSTTGGSGTGLVSYAVAQNDPCSISGNLLTATGAGQCTITASKAADSVYDVASATPITVSVALNAQNPLVASASLLQLNVNGTTTLSTTGGSGTGLVSYAVAQNDPCSISADVLTATGAGQCTITASKAADSVYDAISATPITVNVVLLQQAPLVASATALQLDVNETTTLSTTGGSGTGLVSYAVAPGNVCSINGNVLTATATGLCTITASKAADSEYELVTAAPITVSVSLLQQATLVASASQLQLNVNQTTILSTTGGSGTGLVSFSVAPSNVCSVSGNLLTAIGTGVCTITATKAGDAGYHSASALPITVSVALNAQSPLVANAAALQLNVNGTTILSTTGGSGDGLVTYAVDSGACSISGTVLTATGAGVCSITASKAADSVYDAASATPIIINVALNTQTPLVANAAALQLTVNGTTILSTTGGSGNGLVSYAVALGDACSISGNVLTAIGTGLCTITASKAADSVYDAISAAPITVNVVLNTQTPLVANATALQLTVNGTTILSTTGGSGDGLVTYAVVSGDCSVNDNTLTGNGAGTCSVEATKAADSAYSAVSSGTVTITVTRNAQSALQVAASPSTISISDTSTLSSIGGSGTGAISYTLISGPCSLSDTILTGTGAGSCVITATKALDSRYDAETSRPVTVIVGLSPQSALSVTAAPTTFKTGESSQLSTTGGSGTGSVTYAIVSGPCSLTGNTVSSSVAGKCLVTATKAADSTHAEISSAPLTVTVDLSPQSALVTVASPSTIAVNGISTLGSTGGSGTGAVVYTLVSGPCTLVQNQLTGTGAGSCSVTATKAGDDRYIEVNASPITVTVGLSPQSALAIAAAPTTISVNASSTLTTTGGSGNGAVTYTLVDGPCSVAGSTVTGLGAGTCSLTASKAADTVYAETTSSPISLTVGRAPQSPLSVLANPSSIKVDETSTLSTTGGSGTGSTDYRLVSGPCSINGNALVGLGAGSCVVTASKAADDRYAEVTSSALTITVGLAPQSAISGLANPSTLNVLGTTTLTVTGGSGSGAVSYTLENGPCSITGSSLTGLGEGSCTVTATKAEDARYAEARSSVFTVTVGLAPQSSLSVQASPTSLTVNGTSQLSSLGGSGTGGLSYTLTSGPCSLSGSSLTGLEAGNCVVTVTKSADSTYAIATSEPLSVTVGLAAQTPLVLGASPALSNNTIEVDDTITLITEGGSGSGGTTYQLVSGPCAMAGDRLTGLGEGSCALTATKAADTGYAATTSDIMTVIVGLTPQSQLVLTANPAAIQLSSSSTLSVTGGNGDGAVSYRLVSGPCALTGNTLTGLALGRCDVTATRAANSRYAEATSAPVTVIVGLNTQPTLTLSADPASIAVNGTTMLEASGGAGSGLVTYSVISGACSLSGNVLTGTAAGTCTVSASKAADSQYDVASATPITVSVALNAQVPLVANVEPAGIHVNGQATIRTSGGAGTGALTFTVISGPCTIAGATVTGSADGSCTVRVTRAADEVYDAASTSLTIAVTGVPLDVMASAGDGQATISWTAPTSSVESPITGYHVTGIPAGECHTTGATQCQVTGLTNGSSYSFTVRAENDAGQGAESLSSNIVTPFTLVTAAASPAKPTVGPGDGQVNVSWPQNLTGGDPVEYRVRALPGEQTCTTPFPGRAFATAGCTVTGLVNGTPYQFIVTAMNSEGSADSERSDPATPAAQVNGACGSAISTATLVEPTAFLCAAGEASSVTAEQGRYSWSCRGAGGGTNAQCEVQGRDNPVDDVGTATLTTPTSNGCAIQRAELQPLPQGAPASGATLPFGVVEFEMAGCEATSATIKVTYSGVVEGMSYLKYRHGHWIELTADNANLQLSGNTATFVIEDNGPFDADPAVGLISDPGGPGYVSLPPVPGAVEAPSVTAGDAEATISWAAPLSGGAAVRYTVTSAPEAKTCTVLAPETSCKMTGLTNDRDYTFSIVAENAAGKGPVSAATRSVTPRYAGIPGLCGTAEGQAKLMPPVAGLCASGTASAVTTEQGVHRWTCEPIGSGVPSRCSAPGLSVKGATGTVSFELQPGSGCVIKKADLGPAPFGAPKKVSLPYGLVDFSLNQCTADHVDLRMTFSGSVEGLSLWKWIHQTWTRIPGMAISGHTAHFSIKDNGPYDADPERGVIEDPAALGTSSGKQDQPTLTVKSSKTRIKSGRAVLVKTRGGKGRGKVNYHVKATGGASCRVLRNGAQTLLRTSGTRDGSCTVWATKAATKKYNAAVTSPVTISVICPKP